MPWRQFTSGVQRSGVQSTGVQIECANRLTPTQHTGPSVRVEGPEGQNARLHFPMPTPMVEDGPGMKTAAAVRQQAKFV